MTWTLSAFADEAAPDLAGQIAALHEAGINYIDVRGVDGFNITKLPVEHARTVKEGLDAGGIKVGMFGSPIGKLDLADDLDSDLARLRHLGELAPVLGCNAVRIFSYYNKDGRLPKDEWARASLDQLGQLKNLAADLGLVLYHENERHIYGDLCDDVLAIINEHRDGKTFRAIFDFDNYNQSGEDVWENWLKLRDVTDGIHLKESTKDNLHVPVGHGNGHVQKILADAVARGFSGPLTVEPHLQHSAAVIATGHSGAENQAFSKMTQGECFQIACKAAKDILTAVKAPVA